MIKVLIVDDSKVVQELLSHILGSDPEIKIVGVASSGMEALELTKEKRPDIITMDFHMPGMNGSETTRKIMSTYPTPIIIVSGSRSAKEIRRNFSLIEDGALAVMLRPPGINHEGFASAKTDLIKTIKLMSEIKVVRRFARQQKIQEKELSFNLPETRLNNGFEIIAIGASTGGPAALQSILTGLPSDLKIPVLIVQHISTGFMGGFVEWLNISSCIPVKIVKDGDLLEGGTAYLAPDGFHLGVKKGSIAVLSNDPPEHGMRPAVDYLFRSVTKLYGKNAIGVLLTGMGRDGADELNEMKNAGALTIVQDQETSVIFGMPGEAIRLGAAGHILPIQSIAKFIAKIIK